MFVLAHVGIQGSERANRLADLATELEDLVIL